MAKLAETEIYGKLTVKSDAAVEGTLDVGEDVTVNGVSVVTEDDARLTDTRNPKSHIHLIANVYGLQTALDAKSDTHTHPYEPAFTKNAAFNKAFGSTAGTVCQGNDARLSDTRTPKAHTHAGTDVTSVVATATSSGTCTGNAASATKLAIARTLSLTGDCSGSTTFDGTANKSIAVTVADDSHNHVISNVDGLQTALDDKADLDETGKIVASQLPALTNTNVFVVNSEEDQLVLSVEQGDVCIRTDSNQSFIAINADNTSISDWVEILAAGGGVLSVNGKIGDIVLSPTDVGAVATSTANTIALRNESGDIFCRYINCTAGASTTAPTRIFASYDAYMRYMTPSELSKHLSQYIMPRGAILQWPKSTVPTGWLECNGSAISRTTYAGLYAVTGTTFGAGNGSTTFNIPDLRGEFVRGWDHGRGIDASRTFGSAQGDELKSHSHTLPGAKYGGSTNNVYAGDAGVLYTPTTRNTGGTETRPRNVALMYIIKY